MGTVVRIGGIMYGKAALLSCAILFTYLSTSQAVRCLMCASYAGSSPACEAGTIHQPSGVVSMECALAWTEGCKVMVFKVPRIGDVWTRGCCGGIFPQCRNTSDHFSVGVSCKTDNCNTMNPKTGG